MSNNKAALSAFSEEVSAWMSENMPSDPGFLLPLTFLVPPTGAIIFLAAIYYRAMYGGAISSIMLGVPGASTAVATTFDGGAPRQNRVDPLRP